MMLLHAGLALTALAAGAAPELSLREVRVPNSPIPIEGEITYVRVVDAHGVAVQTTTIPYGKRISLRLRNGSYTLHVWHRFCDGNCGYLDPPGDRCRRAITLRVKTRTDTVVHNRPGSPCRIAATARPAPGG